MGDYNINLLNADTHPPTQEFIDSCFTYSFFPVISKPSRVTQFSATLIDNIITNDISNSTSHQGLFLVDISDHFPVFLVTEDKKQTFTTKTTYNRNLSKINITKFKTKLEATDFEDIQQINDTQVAFSNFQGRIEDIYNSCFPKVKMKKEYCAKLPWLTNGLKNSIKTKNYLYKCFLKNRCRYNEHAYKFYKNKLNNLLRSAERKHYETLLEHNKNNLKTTWKTIKEIINKKKRSSVVQSFKYNNTEIKDPKLIARHFNDFFINVGDSLSKKIPHTNVTAASFLQNYNRQFINTIFLKPATENEIILNFKKLKSSSSGSDEISPKVLKYCHLPLIQPLKHIINLSLSQGVFPNELKIANVIPLFKSGDSALFNNYRPISLLTAFSKIFERIFYARLLNFLNKEDILFKFQFGFRIKHSTYMALLTLVDFITSAIDKGEFVLGIFLDFSKAFDTVNHTILLEKLYFYGIRGVAWNWIKSYLSNRQQFVTYENVQSEPKLIKCGVPQGSILGPLLFLIYINDLSLISDNLFKIMFADDTSMFLSGKSLPDIERTVNNDLINVSTWLKSNKLSLNIDKTHFIVFSPKRYSNYYSPKINIDNHLISEVKHTKFLGVYVDNKLSWKVHLNHICSKIAKGIGILYRAKPLLNKRTLLSLYYSFVYPHLSYCIVIWGKANQCLLQPLIKLQKRAVKCIDNSKKSAPVFSKYNILQLFNIYRYETTLFMYKFKCNNLPSIFDNWFVTSSNLHSYDTRNLWDYHLPLYRKESSKSSMKFSGAYMWNSLDVSLKCSNSKISAYKKLLKKYLSSHDT